MSKTNLLGLTRDEMVVIAMERGVPKWRADQMWGWIYLQDADSFDAMANLPKTLRRDLDEPFSIARPQVVEHQYSADGTEKLALEMEDRAVIEMVLIPEGERNTLCVSSQVGCLVKCAFCYTGTQTFSRNLEAHEIVGQVLTARRLLNDQGHNNSKRSLTNIVMMGMGEPLHNYANVAKALKILMDPKGLALSKRRITLSTSGIVPAIARCGEELGVNLAVSLHAPNDTLRNQIMPINKQFPIASLMEVCRHYPGLNDARKMTFEYVMLKEVNDADAHAKELAKLIEGIPAKVNLIPWNPWPGALFETSSEERIERFARILMKAGIVTVVRSPRGQDISAACGQLKTEIEKI